MVFATPPRLLVLWCPDWPVVAAAAAASLPVMSPAAVFLGNRVVACSATARAHGVTRTMRRREAQSRCPDLKVLAHDLDRDARLFEAVAAAVETHAPGVEVVRPGIVAVPVAGAANYVGSEVTLAESLVDHVAAAAGVESQVGVADGLFAATLAARSGAIVDPGGAATFLAPLPLTELDQPGTARSELVNLLKRLGLRTFADFAALPERDVANRFGSSGVLAHRLARGLDERPALRRRPPPELAAEKSFDPPIERVDQAAFASKTLATQLHTQLAERGLACTQMAIHAVTEQGQQYTRVWRTAEPLTAAGIADRVRWQMEGWLVRRAPGDRPTSGIALLRLEPEETVTGGSLQMTLPAAGRKPDADERAARALLRVQGLLGPDSVFTAVLDGGRGPAERVRLVPWGDRREQETEPAPWPGRLPAPSPATVPPTPWPTIVLGTSGSPVTMTDRADLTETPATVAVTDRPPRRVLRWAGPWPVNEPWWGSGRGRRGVRIQVVLAAAEGETALLLHGQVVADDLLWTAEGLYD